MKNETLPAQSDCDPKGQRIFRDETPAAQGGSEQRGLHTRRQPKRKVFIELIGLGDTWMVFYFNRRKWEHYSAGQFNVHDHSRSDVEAWVRSQPKLQLVEKWNGKVIADQSPTLTK